MIPACDTPFIEEDATWTEFLNRLSLRAHAWVVTNREEMTVVGVITEHDLLRHIVPPEHKRETIFGAPKTETLHTDSRARDVMTHDPVACSPEDTVADVLKRLSAFNVRRLPVVDEGKTLLGEITIQLLVKNLRSWFPDAL